MSQYYYKCTLVGVVLAVVAGVVFTPLDGVGVMVGLVITLLNLWGFSQLVGRLFSYYTPSEVIEKEKQPPPTTRAMLLFGCALFFKLLFVFLAVGLACYFFNPVSVVVGFTTLVAGLFWQSISDLKQPKQ